MTTRRRRAAWPERCLLVVGVACLGYYGYQSMEARSFQREQTAAFEALLAERQLPGDLGRAAETDAGADTAVATSPSPAVGAAPAAAPAPARRVSGAADLAPGVIALLEIPRLGLTSPVVSGDDAAALARGVGHLTDTPRPWEAGNSALAAHRDGIFRPLRRIQTGDVLRVRTAHGEFTYTVSETKIVEPTDLSVLAEGDEDRLTLITCYPFNFVGNAPQRFIVHARRAPELPGGSHR